MINAKCHSDDLAIEVEFDATPWFEQATDKQILDLIHCEWGSDYPADAVAEFMADKNSEIKEMYWYMAIRNRKRDKSMMGFECYIDSVTAIEWITHNRNHLLNAAMMAHTVEFEKSFTEWRGDSDGTVGLD